MKKNTIITFKSNFLKEQDPFHLVVIFFIIFFGTAIFFSIPTFYDYTKFNQEIKETINKDYKIQIDNLENISFRFIPSPHLLIKKSEIKIKNNETEPVANLKNTKVYISLLDHEGISPINACCSPNESTQTNLGISPASQ